MLTLYEFLGFTVHEITGSDKDCIIVELGNIYMTNHLRILLWDCDDRSYSYFIEVSVDRKCWTRVVDHTQFLCRSWQNLHFESSPVRYIKVVGTRNTANSQFGMVALKAFYSKNQPNLVNRLVSPTVNVATKRQGAKVIEGTSDSGHNDNLDLLLNGDINSRKGYIQHVVGTRWSKIQRILGISE